MEKFIDISDQYQLIFIHIPKNAGTSIRKALKMNLDAGGHHPWFFFQRKYPERWAKYTKFAVFRDPYDRALSCFNYAKMEESYWHSSNTYLKHPDYSLLKSRNFKECCWLLRHYREKFQHESWYPQSSWIMDRKSGKIMVDYILRFENLEEDFYAMCKSLKIPFSSGEKEIILPHLNPSQKIQNLEKNEPEIRAILKEIYSSDYSLFQNQSL